MKFTSSVWSAVSGSIGGTTYARNAGGMYARARSMPVNANTAQQTAVRNIIAQLSAAWSGTLTASQRSAWESYAAAVPLPDSLGASRNVSGLNWYIKGNTARMQAGLSRVDAGPAVLALAELLVPSYGVSAGDEGVELTYASGQAWAGEVGGALLVYASRPQNAGVSFFAGPYRYMGKVSGAVSPPASPASMTLPFSVSVGQKVFFRAVAVRADGRVSSSIRGMSIAE